MSRFAKVDAAGNVFISNVKVDGSILLTTKEVPMEAFEISLDVYKGEAIKRVHTFFQKAIEADSSKYSKYEIDTFAAQQEEWRGWKIDSNNPTPMIDKIALARGISKETLLGKIEDNIMSIFNTLGVQQSIEDQILAAADIDTVRTVLETASII
jgi:hypothetical protein